MKNIKNISQYLIFLFVIISISSLTIISYIIGKNREKEIVNNELENIYINIESQISSDIKECNNTIDGVARTMRGLINIDGYTKTQLQQYLADVNNHYIDNPAIMPGFSKIHCYTLDDENMDVFSSATYESSVSDPYQNENGELIITIYKLYDVTDDRSFVICIDISLEELNKRTFTTRHNFTGTWFILDSHHIFLCHPDKLFINQYLGDLHYGIAKYCEVLTKQGSVTYERFVNYRGLESLLVIRPFNTNWFLGVTIPIYEYLNQIRSLKILYITASIIVIIVFGLVLLSIINKRLKAETQYIIESQNSKNKSAFLASMSHEIRTPLNAVIGISEIQLQNPDISGKIRESFQDIFESGDVLLSLINDILDISKVESAKMEVINVEYKLCKLVEEAMYFNKIKYTAKPIDVKLEVAEDTLNDLYGDVSKLKQILNNVLSNAFKYTNHGTIKLLVSTIRHGGDVVILRFEVEDTGIGMTKGQVSQLFNEFSRFEEKEEILGTGLGMSITKKLVELMNGTIKVNSIYKVGTTFIIEIPQTKNSDILYEHNLKFTPFENKIEFKKKDFSGANILCVDDVSNNLNVIKGLLFPYKVNIHLAQSGDDTIDLIKSGNNYDIIFLDYYMPAMNGIETCRKLRILGYKGPIVALTANAMYGQRQVFIDNEFDEYLSKPIDSRELDRILNLYLKEKIKIILIVDDVEINLEIAQALLQSFGVEPDLALSGEEAIELVKKKKYDIILMDYHMNGMNGDECLREIRKLGFTMKIYALSASDTDDVNKFKEMGFDGFFTKPIRAEDVNMIL